MKHLLRPARHIDAVVVAPLDQKIAALEMSRDFPLRPAREHAGHAHRARARAAGPGFAGAAVHNRSLFSTFLPS